MPIKIKKIITQTEKHTIAILTHGNQQLTAKIHHQPENRIQANCSENIHVELGYDKLITAKLLQNFKDEDACIQATGKHFIIKGRVHQLMELEDDTIIDLYIQTGPEFIAFQQSEIGELKVKKGQGLQIEVTDLQFFPTNI